jgi:hypothetical protein
LPLDQAPQVLPVKKSALQFADSGNSGERRMRKEQTARDPNPSETKAISVPKRKTASQVAGITRIFFRCRYKRGN